MVINDSQRQRFTTFLFLGRQQVVFSFQLPANGGRALPLFIIIDFLSLPVDAQGDDMDMGPADILVPVDDIGLVAIPHHFHVFLPDGCQLLISQYIVRVRIE